MRFIEDFTTATFCILLFTAGPSYCWLFTYFAYILPCNDQYTATIHGFCFNLSQILSTKHANIASSSSTNRKVSAVIDNHTTHCHSSLVSGLFQHYKHYDFMCVIDMNTHFLLLFNYYIAVTFAQILFASCFKKLIDCWFIWNSVNVIVFQVKNSLHQKVNRISWKISILRFNFRILMLNFCKTILHTQIVLHFFWFHYLII